jgi:ferric-dicitrate binding protein FerR (iron transport regulator)
VPYGRRANIELSDGSKIWLNSGSKFIFPATFEGDKREVYLEGEGIFEVNRDKNRPFVVKAYNHEIQVLGTVFNVSNYTDENTISTVLKSGSVLINLKNGSFFNSKESIKITPGTLAVYNKSDMEVITKKVEIEKYFSWRDGIYIFKNAPMQSIMKKISRYYNIDIIINDAYLANQTFSGYLDVKDTVENVLNTIKETTEFEYHITENNKLIIN